MTGARESIPPSDVAGAYDLWAATYDADPNRTRDRAGEILRARAAGPDGLAGRRVVEAGCGTGRHTGWLADRARTVVALDFSAGMLREAQARVRSDRVVFLRHDLRRGWPLRDDAVDAVIVLLVLEHVEALAPVFGEAARVLRPGGELFVCELHPTRQMLGRRAEFVDARTGASTRIASFVHDVSDYVNAGLDAGLGLRELREWRDPGAPRDAPPRLLSVAFSAGRPAAPATP